MQNHLKPMGIRDILDSTFSIMRQRFWTFQNVVFRASLLPFLVLCGGLAIGFVFIAILALSAKIPFGSPQFFAKIFTGNIIAVLLAVIFSLAFIVALLITAVLGYLKFCFGVIKVYQAGFHQQPCSAKQALQGIRGKRLRIFLVAFIVWIFLYIASIPGMLVSSLLKAVSPPAGYIVSVANFILEIGLGFFVCLSPVVAVVEDWDVYQIIKRSFNLLARHRWRIFGSMLLIYLLAYVIWFVLIGFAASPLLLLFLSRSPWLIALVILVFGLFFLFVLSALAVYHFGPLTAIYYDLIIRKEGYDIQLQLKAAAAVPAEPAPGLRNGVFDRENV